MRCVLPPHTFAWPHFVFFFSTQTHSFAHIHTYAQWKKGKVKNKFSLKHMSTPSSEQLILYSVSVVCLKVCSSQLHSPPTHAPPRRCVHSPTRLARNSHVLVDSFSTFPPPLPFPPTTSLCHRQSYKRLALSLFFPFLFFFLLLIPRSPFPFHPHLHLISSHLSQPLLRGRLSSHFLLHLTTSFFSLSLSLSLSRNPPPPSISHHDQVPHCRSRP